MALKAFSVSTRPSKSTWVDTNAGVDHVDMDRHIAEVRQVMVQAIELVLALVDAVQAPGRWVNLGVVAGGLHPAVFDHEPPGVAGQATALLTAQASGKALHAVGEDRCPSGR
jgi:hypothetical protein